MSGLAIMMMVLFMVVIWGGLAASIVHLRKHPDEISGDLRDFEYATDDALVAQEHVKH